MHFTKSRYICADRTQPGKEKEEGRRLLAASSWHVKCLGMCRNTPLVIPLKRTIPQDRSFRLVKFFFLLFFCVTLSHSRVSSQALQINTSRQSLSCGALPSFSTAWAVALLDAHSCRHIACLLRKTVHLRRAEARCASLRVVRGNLDADCLTCCQLRYVRMRHVALLFCYTLTLFYLPFCGSQNHCPLVCFNTTR